MTKRDHLKRLPPEAYQGLAVVHWTQTMLDRRTGWLGGKFLYRFRELLTHSAFRYAFACPIFCLMPDHFHMIWLGISPGSDQRAAMKHFRKSMNDSLSRIGFELQDQPYDHVLSENERQESAFRSTCDYVARNPERAGLVPVDGYASYPYSGCLVPGYPELRVFDEDFWDRFDRSVSYLRQNGLTRLK